MTQALETAIERIQKAPSSTQEALGRFINAALNGELQTLEEFEEQVMLEQVTTALEDWETNRIGYTEEEMKVRMEEFIAELRSWKQRSSRGLPKRISAL